MTVNAQDGLRMYLVYSRTGYSFYNSVFSRKEIRILMKENNSFGNLTPHSQKIIDLDSSSSESVSQASRSHSVPQVTSQNHSQEESSHSSSKQSEESSNEQQQSGNVFLQNLAPIGKEKKKQKSLIRLRDFFLSQSLNSFASRASNQLSRSEVNALMLQVDSNAEEEDSSEFQKQKRPSSKRQRKTEYSTSSRPSNAPVDSNWQDQQSMGQSKKKPKLMEELQAEIIKPVEQLLLNQVDPHRKQKMKKQQRRREYIFQKGYRQLKMGKKKDEMSNTVFNAIQDYFN